MKVRRAGANSWIEALHVRGLDAEANKKELTKAIKKKIGHNNSRVSGLRSNASNTQAATVVLKKPDAATLIEDRHIILIIFFIRYFSFDYIKSQ